jgi:hypothetical protein
MKVLGWIATGLRATLALHRRRRQPRKPANRVTAPRIESLESYELMSLAAHALHAAVPRPAAHVATMAPVAEEVPFTVSSVMANTAHAMTMNQTTAVQTATVPDTLTNFSAPFAPPLALFNPSLGQLVAVHITATPTITSLFTVTNTSPNGPAPLSGLTTGTFAITGLVVPITGILQGQTATEIVPPLGSFTFPPLVNTTTQTIDVTDPATLATFVATPGRTTITPVLTETAGSTASGPPGNTQFEVRTSGSGVVTISYEYMPMCPPVTNLVRFGIHHQPTQLQLTFGGLLPDAADASNPANYVVIGHNVHGSFTGPGIRIIPVVSAVYTPDPLTNTSTVTLTTARQLNVHHQFLLRVTLACNNGNPLFIQFGGKKSLGGFELHGVHFVVVNGKAIPG